MSVKETLADALQRAGWALYDAALRYEVNSCRHHAFDDAMKVAETLIEQGYDHLGRELQERIAKF